MIGSSETQTQSNQAHLHREPERGVGEHEREWKEDEAGGGDDEGVAGEGEEAAQQDAHQVAAHRDCKGGDEDLVRRDGTPFSHAGLIYEPSFVLFLFFLRRVKHPF